MDFPHLRSFRSIENLVRDSTPILLVGETGAGKRTLARLLHQHPLNPFRRGRLVEVDCEMLLDPLLHATLIGYLENGRLVEGALMRANRGTLVFQHMEAAPPVVQSLLKALIERREIYPPFRNPLPFRGLIISTSRRALDNRDNPSLQYMMDTVKVLPLRRRRDELPAIIERIVEGAWEAERLPILGITGEAKRVLVEHPWRVNFYELQSVLIRSSIEAHLRGSVEIDLDDVLACLDDKRQARRGSRARKAA